MLPDLEPATDARIVEENLQAAQAVYTAYQLEQMHVFDVADRIAELFAQGLLPLGSGPAAQALQRYLEDEARLLAHERAELYSRVFGLPVATEAAQPNRQFQALWLRFVTGVAQLERLAESAEPSVLAISRAALRRVAVALALNLSRQAAGLAGLAAARLAADVKALLALLALPQIVQTFQVQDQWQLIEQVSRDEFGIAVNVPRYRTLAQASGTILGWLAVRVEALNTGVEPAADALPSDAALAHAVHEWLAAAGAADAADGEPAPPAALQPISLTALARELLQRLDLPDLVTANGQPVLDPRGVVALFRGARGSGKTLAAHVLAAALAREIWRVDLSQLAGDSVGETEQNLESLLTRAEQAGAVLLFEECEALFGSGTAGGFEAERLLRRLEAHPGVTILELRGENEAIDEALRQRARAVVQFPRWRGRG